MYRLPAPSSATLRGAPSCAAVAAPPSPNDDPPPATVEIFPEESTLRMRLLFTSAMYRLPAASSATSWGLLSCAAVAAPPSPLKPAVPVPATVEITPAEFTLRMRWLFHSAMYRLPARSSATPSGRSSSAAVAAPPSPRELPPPATVSMTQSSAGCAPATAAASAARTSAEQDRLSGAARAENLKKRRERREPSPGREREERKTESAQSALLLFIDGLTD